MPQPYLILFQRAILPMTLYAAEVLLKYFVRGKRAFLVTRVEWMEPVMALKILPLDKSAFNFLEGQYLLLNCPAISERG